MLILNIDLQNIPQHLINFTDQIFPDQSYGILHTVPN